MKRRSNITACAVLAATLPALLHGATSDMPHATPESQGVASQAILNWLDACEARFCAGHVGSFKGALHGFVLMRHGKVIAEGSWKPFDTLREPHVLYSHSKSFTSTAIGFLVDDGKLDLDERVTDIFSNAVPACVSENMRQMRVRDLLTMNDGMAPGDVCINVPDIRRNWVTTFMSAAVTNKPGTRFRYDSCATYMLSAIVSQRTGGRMMDYLGRRLFQPLGFTGAWSATCPDGIDCGGWGMYMTTRDLAKFGQLYLRHGVWNDNQILSSEWVTLATARQTWSGGITVHNQTIGSGSDWKQGYGFQFWRCRHGAYRADGAFGQYTIVMPREDAVLSIHAGLGDMQGELNLVWDYLLPALQNAAPLPTDAAAEAKLKARLENLSLAPVAGVREGDDAFVNRTFKLKKNARDLTSLRVTKTPTGWTLRIGTKTGLFDVPVGYGTWQRGAMRIDSHPHDLGELTGELMTQGSGAVTPEGRLCMRVYLANTTTRIDVTFAEKNGQATATGALASMISATIDGTAETNK